MPNRWTIRFGILAGDASRETIFRLCEPRNRGLKSRRCNKNKSFLPQSGEALVTLIGAPKPPGGCYRKCVFTVAPPERDRSWRLPVAATADRPPASFEHCTFVIGRTEQKGATAWFGIQLGTSD